MVSDDAPTAELKRADPDTLPQPVVRRPGLPADARPWLPWAVAGALAAWQYLGIAIATRADEVSRSGGGITLSTITALAHGRIPHADFYEPYGLGLGLPGRLLRLLGFDGALSIGLAYGLLAPLATLLAVVFVWRRYRPAVAILTGAVALTVAEPTWSATWAAVFGFALVVDELARRTRGGTLAAVAAQRPWALLGASAILSLAGWARLGYALLPLVWAAVLLVALPRGPVRRRLAAGTAALASLPTVLIVMTGGFVHLWWVVKAGSYGVGAIVVVVAAIALTPPARARLLRFDRTFMVPFLIGGCAVLLLPASPNVRDVSPVGYWKDWTDRPSVGDREPIKRLGHVPVAADGSAESMAALQRLWTRLELPGRPVLSVNRRNDVASRNDAIVNFLLDAPPAAWPLTYDPGLAGEDHVQREAVDDLCRNRAPIVQLEGIYPSPSNAETSIGSRRLDEFLAANYRVAAIAGFYRILLPTRSGCRLPAALGDVELVRLRDRWLNASELPAAGAVAVTRMEQAAMTGRMADSIDAATAALGGYRLRDWQLPSGTLGEAVQTLQDGRYRPGLIAAAADEWPSDVEQLAAQTAWLRARRAGEVGEGQAAGAVFNLVRRHPTWAQAITNASAVVPAGPEVFGELAGRGAAGVPEFERWRRDTAMHAGDREAAITAGVALAAAYDRRRDPVHAGQAELELAAMPGLEPGCRGLLRRHANARPGVWAKQRDRVRPCPRPALRRALGGAA